MAIAMLRFGIETWRLASMCSILFALSVKRVVFLRDFDVLLKIKEEEEKSMMTNSEE
jgi:hypothetical protein